MSTYFLNFLNFYCSVAFFSNCYGDSLNTVLRYVYLMQLFLLLCFKYRHRALSVMFVLFDLRILTRCLMAGFLGPVMRH